MCESNFPILLSALLFVSFYRETLGTNGKPDLTTPQHAPSRIKLESTMTTISISWQPPSNPSVPVKGYVVGWGSPVPYDYTKVLDASQRFYQLTGLKSSHEYVISVRAFYDPGDGPPIYESIWTRAQATPEAKISLLPPIGLRVDLISPTSVLLLWSETNHNYHGLRIYTVRYSSDFKSASSPKYKYLNTTDTSLLLNGLMPNTQYEFAVKMVKGTWSMSAQFTTMESQEKSEGQTVPKLQPFHSMIFLISSISGSVLLLIIAVSILFIKSRRAARSDHGSSRKHNGYIAAATSPVGGGKNKSNIELKPPDLWIRHNDPLEVFW